MKFFYRVMAIIWVSGLISCSNLWANDIDCGDGFLCHTIEKRDIGWTYFALAQGVLVSDLRNWNPEVSKKGIDYFPVGVVIKYKTRDMEENEIKRDMEENEIKRKKIMIAMEREVKERFSYLREKIKQSEIVSNDFERKLEIVSNDFEWKSGKSKLFFLTGILFVGFILLGVSFFVYRIKSKMENSIERIEEKPIFSDPVVIKVWEEKFSFSPVVKDNGFVCPFFQNGQIKTRLFPTKSDLKRSLISNLKKNPGLFDEINKHPNKFGKIRNFNPSQENQRAR